MSVTLSEQQKQELQDIKEEMIFLNLKIGSGQDFDSPDTINHLRNVAWGVKVLIEILLGENDNANES